MCPSEAGLKKVYYLVDSERVYAAKRYLTPQSLQQEEPVRAEPRKLDVRQDREEGRGSWEEGGGQGSWPARKSH